MAAVQSADDAYFVLGVQPHNMMLQIDEARIEDGTLMRFVNVLPLHEYGQSDGDFVVAKVKGGSQLALHSASIMAGHSIFGMLFRPSKETLSFKVPAGKVVYITNVAFNGGGGAGLTPTYTNGLQGARDFVAIHYPALAGKVEQGEYQIVACGPGHCRF